jgi:hypothetical protein
VGVDKDREGGKGHACRWQGTEAFLDRNLDKTRELTSSIEPLAYLLRVSLSPTPNLTQNRCFAGGFTSALSAEYPPISLNIAPTVDKR